MQSSAVSPPTASAATSAPVHEFICLFTHDLRRKQKRWQDGRLKYHTHNSRVMVHDESGNTVGDTHWRKDYSLDSGEVINLDRGGVIVEVGDLIVTRNQDLTELVDKRLKEKIERQSAAAARRPNRPQPPAVGLPTPTRSLYPPTGLKSLQEVVGTPTGHHGRAQIPSESPFEQRQRLASGPLDEASPPAKRQKRVMSPPSKSGYAQSLFGAALSLSTQPMSSAPLRFRPVNTSSIYRPTPVVLSSSPAEGETLAVSESNKPTEQPRLHSNSVATGSMSLQARGALPSLLQTKPQERPAVKVRKTTGRQKRAATSQNVEETSISAPMSKKVAPTAKKRIFPVPSETPDKGQIPSKNDVVPTGPNVIEIQSSDEVTSQNESNRKIKKKKLQDAESVKPKRSKENARSAHKLAKSTTHPSSSHSDLSTTTAFSSMGREDDQPRTELRIKPRKKRGLLMLAHQRSAAAEKSQSVESSPFPGSTQPVHRIQTDGFESSEPSDAAISKPISKIKVSKAKKPKEPARDTTASAGSCKEPELVPSLPPSSLTVPREIKRRKARAAAIIEMTVSDDDCSDNTPLVDEELSDYQAKPPERLPAMPADREAKVIGPRLVRFPRKHINSREIIGLNFDDDNDDDLPKFGRSLSPVGTPIIVSEPARPENFAKQSVTTTISAIASGDVEPISESKELTVTQDESDNASQMEVPSATKMKPDSQPEIRAFGPAKTSSTVTRKSSMPRSHNIADKAPTSDVEAISKAQHPSIASPPEAQEIFDSDEQAKPQANIVTKTGAPISLQATDTSQSERTAPAPKNQTALTSQNNSKATVDSAVQNTNSLARELSKASQPEPATSASGGQSTVTDRKQSRLALDDTTVQNSSSQVHLDSARDEIPQGHDDNNTHNTACSEPCGPGSTAQLCEPLQANVVKLCEHLEVPTNIDEMQATIAGTTTNIRCEPSHLAIPLSADRSADKLPDLSPNLAKPTGIENIARKNPPFVAPRLVNPATRGRKAAKPSDAAGQTPQCPLPADSHAQAGIGLARLRGLHGRPTLVRSNSSVSTTMAALNPSFTRANGGPWSREAYDLFEYQHPG